MKVFLIVLALIISGCTDAGKSILKAEITGEKYTIFIPDMGSYKVNDYHVQRSTGVVSFLYKGSEYKANVWMIKATKSDI